MSIDDIKLTYEGGHPLCWLTWCERDNGLVELRAVSLTAKHAGYSRQMVTAEKDSGVLAIIRVWTEKREAQHCFGGAMTDEMMALVRRTLPRQRDGGE